VILMCRFALADQQAADFLARARRALGMLSGQPGCLGGQLGRCPDDPTRWLLLVRFASVLAYRRALSTVEVRARVVPLLAEALAGDPGCYEVLAEAVDGVVTDHPSLLAADAEQGHRSGDRYCGGTNH
jgi:quinol monooxygenase YgiN